MPVTTTASIRKLVLRCEVCHREAVGGVCLQNGYGQWVAWCHASESMKDEMRRLFPDVLGTRLPRPDPAPVVGVDPLGRWAGVHPSDILAAQGIRQTLTKAPRRDQAEEPEPITAPSPDDGGAPAYQSRRKAEPDAEDVERHQGSVGLPPPLMGTRRSALGPRRLAR